MKMSSKRNGFHRINYDNRINELIDTPVYDEALMQNFFRNITDNLYNEMLKQEISLRSLGEISRVNYSHLSRIFNGEARIGLEVLIKLLYSLHVNSEDIISITDGKHMSNGRIFQEIVRPLDQTSIDYLLKFCEEYVIERRRIIHELK